ncbi:MAG: cell wall metabolism sensor histidine kinase WalK [Oscillospiraceae bacterium]|nr:cell wall metabolism sensor histidine kinase WalK [Oscillospiraceae bacterium]
MSKSLNIKLVFIMLLIIVLLMTVVLAFLARGVQDFHTAQFYSQMESIFTKTELVSELRLAADEGDVKRMDEILSVFMGELGIDRKTRNYYILDGITGEVLETSDTSGNTRIKITLNILKAIRGENALKGNSRADYMDVAVPITISAASAASGASGGFVVYIIDNKQTAQSLNTEILALILQAVLIGFAISIAIILIISKTLLSPIQGMTKAAEAMADGDFSRKIRVDSKDEIGILAKTFNDMASQIETMLEELKKAEKLRREFVANVSHELRTPLTSIRTYAETMSENQGIPQETEREFLHVIINESDRMTKIVQDLLELSRFDSGNSKMAVEAFSIEQSLRDVYAAIALEARRRKHVFNLELEWKLPNIKGDRARIEQVLMNIISNAMKYTPDGGTINICAGSSDSNIWVSVEDSGIGIPEEDLTRIFDRFYRVEKARSREAGGTGLGLSIAREIVKRHGGDLSVKSEQGVGTTVTMTLPIEGAGAI